MRIVQLSDLHLTDDARPLYGHVHTEAAAQAACRAVLRLVPAADLLLLTGDLANGGAVAAYRRLKTWLAASGVPYALVPGNHDDRAGLRQVFPEQGWAENGLCCQRLDGVEGSLLLLDTLIPGAEEGELGARQMDWLGQACPVDRPVLLAMHHPPFTVGIPGMDAIRCRGEAALKHWLAGRDNVEGLLCGHVHRFVATSFAGRPALVAPSPAHQIAFVPGPLAYTLEPGGLLVHDWQPGERLVSHYLPVSPAEIHVYGE